MATAASADVDFAQAHDLGNEVIAHLNAMREVDPIFQSQANGGIWVVTGHKEVADGFAGKKPLSSVRLPDLAMMAIDPERRERDYPEICKVTRNWVINMDRPASWRLRNLAQKAFSSAAAEAMRPFVRGFVDEAFAEVEGLDRFEFVDKVARRVPARTILKLFGLGDEVYPLLHEWSISLNAALAGVNQPEPILAAAEQTMVEMRALFLPIIDARRANPGDDFISALVTARDAEDDRLTEEELIAMLIIVLIAGHDTTANTIALGTAALAGLPEARAYIRNNPDDLGNAVMEIMRYVAMSTMMPRIVTETFEWGGHEIAAGSIVFLMIAGANRDPAAFPDPEQFDATRPQAKNMTFAPGLHFCIGHFLAKVQLQEFFAALAERYDPEILDERLNFGRSISFRGVETLDMRLHKRG